MKFLEKHAWRNIEKKPLSFMQILPELRTVMSRNYN